MDEHRRVAVVTGASAGIGAATAEALAKNDFDLIVGARRIERIEELGERIGGRALPLDVTDPDSVTSFAAQIDRVDVLVNNAGLAVGLHPLAELSDDDFAKMWETNVAGLLRVTRALMPKLLESHNAHIVNVGSIAGFETYKGGGGYTATKHAVRALTRTLRLELLGKPVRITEIDPGLVETEFSLVRFAGDEAKAKKTYEGLVPLTGADIGDAIAWAITRPPHVDIDEIVIRPVAQANVDHVDRSG